MTSGTFDLFGFASKFLDLVQEQLTDMGVSVPDRVYVAPALDLAFDCEQLTVHLARIISNFQGQDTPYPVVTHAKLRKSAELFVTLVRCVPVMNDDGSPPSVDALQAAAGVQVNDMSCLRRAVEQIEHQHLLLPINVPATVGPAQSIGPLGGLAASQVMYTAEIQDTAGGWR